VTWTSRAVLTWGAGWAVAAVMLPLSALLIGFSSPAAFVIAALVVGTPLVGVPIYITARATGARYAAVEAVVWVVLLAAIVLIVVRATVSFETINAVTTEDIRRRQHGGTWPYPPELVWGLRGAATFCILAGLGSMLLNGGPHHLWGRLWRAPLFGAAAGLSLAAAAILFTLAGPFIWRLFPLLTLGGSPALRLFPIELVGVAAAAFPAGCLAGAGILAARRALLNA
jgi:hypothetical protein